MSIKIVVSDFLYFEKNKIGVKITPNKPTSNTVLGKCWRTGEIVTVANVETFKVTCKCLESQIEIATVDGLTEEQAKATASKWLTEQYETLEASRVNLNKAYKFFS